MGGFEFLGETSSKERRRLDIAQEEQVRKVAKLDNTEHNLPLGPSSDPPVGTKYDREMIRDMPRATVQQVTTSFLLSLSPLLLPFLSPPTLSPPSFNYDEHTQRLFFLSIITLSFSHIFRFKIVYVSCLVRTLTDICLFVEILTVNMIMELRRYWPKWTSRQRQSQTYLFLKFFNLFLLFQYIFYSHIS